MANHQSSPAAQTSAASVPDAVPSLQLLQTDADAGLCVDGYCVLPPAAQTTPDDSAAKDAD